MKQHGVRAVLRCIRAAEKRGLTQHAIARRVKVSVVSLQNWKTRKNVPRPENAERVVKALGKFL